MDMSEKKILVTEDEDALREMLVVVLKDEDYQVDSASDGKAALELLSQNNYDLLATDLFMPEMNGAELIRKCRNSYPDTKILLLSGGGRELEAEHKNPIVKFEGETIEVDLYMKKPCNLNELLSVVEELLDN